jgi:tRNA U55 pseudouridine synthase TruB
MAPFDFPSGEILLVNKPYGWTSFDVVNKIRYAIKKELGIKKIKIGHAGTLDPLATGLLILCTGRSTKKIDEFIGYDKEYTGTFTLGSTTQTTSQKDPSARQPNSLLEPFSRSPRSSRQKGSKADGLTSLPGKMSRSSLSPIP